MNVIIVDDDALVVSALTTIVESSGHTVIATGNSGRKRSGYLIHIILTF